MRLGRGVADASKFQNLANQRVAVKAVVGSHGAYLNLAGVMPPCKVISDARVEIAVDVEYIPLAMLPRLDDSRTRQAVFSNGGRVKGYKWRKTCKMSWNS